MLAAEGLTKGDTHAEIFFLIRVKPLLEKNVAAELRQDISDCTILLPSRFPCSPRDSWREPRGAEEGGRESSKADLVGRLLRAPCWRNLQSP